MGKGVSQLAARAWESRIDRAWRFRFNQDWVAFRDELASLRATFGVPTSRLFPTDWESLAVSPIGREILLLTVSQLRGEGDSAGAQTILDWLRERGECHSFSYLSQQGLQCLVRGDQSQALTFFVAAEKMATRSWQKLCVCANKLFCLDHLGLPFDPEADVLKTDGREMPAVASQVRAFRARQYFRAGRIDDLFALKLEAMEQALYFRLWVSELPYHAHYRTIPKQWATFLDGCPEFFLKFFRLRTLQGLSHPNDATDGNASEWIDRLYLWTWRWMTSPRDLAIERVTETLRRCVEISAQHRLTVEDFLLARNAVGWLTRFDPSRRDRIERWLAGIAPGTSNAYPLLTLEWECQRGIVGRALPGILLPALVAGKKVPVHLVPLQKDLLRPAGTHIPPGTKVFVDLARRTVKVGRGPTIESALLSDAIAFFESRPATTVNELLRHCFGITRPDRLIHLPKVANLLSRLRRLAPAVFQFSIRGDLVHRKGNFSGVFVRGIETRADELLASAVWTEMAWAKPRVPAERTMRVAPAIAEGEWTREDLEGRLHRSKSSVNRQIKKWLEEGKIKQLGRARGTRYRWIATEGRA